MIYQGGTMLLDPISELFHGTVNDVLICRDLKSPIGMCYTLLVIHDRECVKTLLRVLENDEREREGEPYLMRFSQNEAMCFLFDYRPERRLTAFAAGQMTNGRIRERLCINLVMECLSTTLPYPLLYLTLMQGQVQVEKDNSIYFTPCLDLEELDEEKGETHCVARCVDILLDILEGGARRKKQLTSFELIHKKRLKNAYNIFPELYRDIKISALPDVKQGWKARFKAFWLRNRDRIFHGLLVFCIVIVVITLLMLISQLIFGDIPLLRLFERAFEQIGTERLKP